MRYPEKMARAAMRARAYRARHPERVRARNRAYYESNKEKCIEATTRWRRKNWPLIKLQIKCRESGIKAPSIKALRAGRTNG